jgi:hypothetical protein
LRSGSNEYFRPHSPKVCLDAYCNAVLSLVLGNLWLMNVDADQIYETLVLLKVIRSVRSAMTVVCFPRVKLICRSQKAFVFRSGPVINPCDRWIVFNSEITFRMNLRRDFGGPWEEAIFRHSVARVSAPLVIYHVPYEKSWRHRNITQDELILFSKWYSSAAGSTRRQLAILNSGVPDRVCEALSELS